MPACRSRAPAWASPTSFSTPTVSSMPPSGATAANSASTISAPPTPSVSISAWTRIGRAAGIRERYPRPETKRARDRGGIGHGPVVWHTHIGRPAAGAAVGSAPATGRSTGKEERTAALLTISSAARRGDLTPNSTRLRLLRLAAENDDETLDPAALL